MNEMKNQNLEKQEIETKNGLPEKAKTAIIIGAIVAVVVAVAVIAIILLSGDNNSSDTKKSDSSATPTHTHSFGSWVTTTQATCITEGNKERYCECGEKQNAVISIIEHSYIDGICSFCSGNENNDNTQIEKLGVFDKYEVKKIYPFYNGLAMFLTKKGLCGCIDIHGNVVIKPIYYESRGYDSGIQGFKYGCARLYNGVSGHYLFDKEGNELFPDGSVGEISGGYFSVETRLDSSEWMVTYYRASDLQIVASFENCRAHKPVSAQTGQFAIYKINEDKTAYFNIADYDPSFTPETQPPIEFDMKQHETYKDCAYYVYYGSQTQDGIIYTLTLNYSNKTLYSIAKQDGTVLLEPQATIALIGQFSNELCLAKDKKTGKYGFVDIYGNWKIPPTYNSGMVFSDGYAVVNDIFVINTTGNIVLGPTE